MIQIWLLCILLIACLYRGGRAFSARLLVAFCMLDMFLASALNAYGTVVSMQRLSEEESPIKEAPRYFPVPDNRIAVAASNDTQRNLGLLLANTSIYFKTPAADGYNSFLLNTHNRLQKSVIHDSVYANPYLYFGTGISTGTHSTPLSLKTELRMDMAAFMGLSVLSLAQSGTRSIRVLQFLPNKITAAVSTPDTALLNLQQNYATGWRLFADGKQIRVIRTNYAQMAGLIPPGRHEVTWIFNPPYIRALAFFTIIGLLLLIATLIVFNRRLL